MNLIEKAFFGLYPKKVLAYETKLNYSRRLKPYNANVKISGNKLQFSLSKEWCSVDEEIVIGLLQELLMRVFKGKCKTRNIELYYTFIKKLHLVAPKTKQDKILEDSFERVNAKYFYGLMEKPNLVFGNYTTTKLGSYDFHTDTITISSILRHTEPELLDYVMYHEMLHKKLKFSNRGLKTYHHTSEFKKREKEFENSELMESKLKKLVRMWSCKLTVGKFIKKLM